TDRSPPTTPGSPEAAARTAAPAGVARAAGGTRGRDPRRRGSDRRRGRLRHLGPLDQAPRRRPPDSRPSAPAGPRDRRHRSARTAAVASRVAHRPRVRGAPTPARSSHELPRARTRSWVAVPHATTRLGTLALRTPAHLRTGRSLRLRRA